MYKQEIWYPNHLTKSGLQLEVQLNWEVHYFADKISVRQSVCIGLNSCNQSKFHLVAKSPSCLEWGSRVNFTFCQIAWSAGKHTYAGSRSLLRVHSIWQQQMTYVPSIFSAWKTCALKPANSTFWGVNVQPKQTAIFSLPTLEQGEFPF